MHKKDETIYVKEEKQDMNFLEIITKLFGNKAQKDMHAIQPIVDRIKAEYETIDALSNDDLRARSHALMDMLQAAVADKKARIAEKRPAAPAQD